RLQQLFEDDAVLRVLPGGDAHRPHAFPDRRMTEHVVRARWLFDPEEIEIRQRADTVDRFLDVPALIGVDHQLVLRSDLLTDESDAGTIVLNRRANFDLEVRPSFRGRFPAEMTNLFVRIADPPGGRGVGGVAIAEKLRFPLRSPPLL